MAARLARVGAPQEEVYDAHRPVRAAFDFGSKTSARGRSEAPKPVTELFAKSTADQKAAAAEAMARALAS
eukprot:2346661-Alexandrium_andersonii.AAC.1